VTRHEDVNSRVLCHLGPLVVPGPGELGRGHLHRTHGPWVCSTHTQSIKKNIPKCHSVGNSDIVILQIRDAQPDNMIDALIHDLSWDHDFQGSWPTLNLDPCTWSCCDRCMQTEVLPRDWSVTYILGLI
jgi:hypothetical protein